MAVDKDCNLVGWFRIHFGTHCVRSNPSLRHGEEISVIEINFAMAGYLLCIDLILA